MASKKIGEILLEQEKISRKQLAFCLDIKRQREDLRLGEILSYYNFIDSRDIAKAIALQVRWEFFDGEYVPDLDVVEQVGIDFFVDNLIYPIKNGSPKFVVASISDTKSTDRLMNQYDNARFCVGAEDDVRVCLNWLLQADIRKKKDNYELMVPNENNLLEWFDQLLSLAILQGATDVHIEPNDKSIIVRFRVDGLLHSFECLVSGLRDRLVNIVFMKANIDTSSFRHFHDARFEFECFNRKVDIRLSHVPTICGSELVLRLLDKGRSTVSLPLLGYSLEHMGIIENALKKPYGIILLVGPTGCGKTTTLYSCLNALKNISTKIITVEDPVEIKHPLISQIEVNEKIGVDFDSSAKSILRHDPDIIFIGEIRDPKTASSAIRAAITGHKVFSTLHTTTPLDSILRLTDLGVGLSYIASSLTCVISQRLVRKLCPYCKQKIPMKRANVSQLAKKYLEDEEQEVFQEVGCDKCTDGYVGRTVVAEVLNIDDTVRSFITKNNIDQLYEYLQNNENYISFQKDIKRLIKKGITSINEAVRVLG